MVGRSRAGVIALAMIIVFAATAARSGRPASSAAGVPAAALHATTRADTPSSRAPSATADAAPPPGGAQPAGASGSRAAVGPGEARLPAAAGRKTIAPAARPASLPGPAWLPAGTRLVLRIRYAEARSSSLFRKLASSRHLFRSELAPIDRLAAAGVIDPSRDLELAWIGSEGTEGGRSVALVTGRFDERAIVASLDKRGAAHSIEGGYDLYRLPAEADGPVRGAQAGSTIVAVAGPGVLIAGSADWVRRALELATSVGPSAISDVSLGPILARVDEGASVWAGASNQAIGAKLQAQLAAGGFDNEGVDLIRTLAASFRIAGDVRVDADAACGSDEDATLLEMTLRGILAVGAYQTAASDPDSARALRETRVERRGSGVRLTTRIPAVVALRG